MIPDNGWHEARYQHTRDDGTTYTQARPVVAWDTSGDPLVLHSTHSAPYGRLQRADLLPGFCGIAETGGPVVAVAPGGNWHIKYRDPDDGSVSSTPVIGWAIRAGGTCLPIETDAFGMAGIVGEDGVDVSTSVLHHASIQPEPWDLMPLRVAGGEQQ